MLKEWSKLKPWIKDGILGAVAGAVLYVLRTIGIAIPYFSDWNAADLSLGFVGVTMIVAYAVAGMFIGELIGLVTGKRR